MEPTVASLKAMRGGGGDPSEFSEMQAAYQILCSVVLRQRYDETGKTDIPAEARLLGP